MIFLTYRRLEIALCVTDAVMDIVISLLIVNIIHESSKVRLTNDHEGNVRFRRADHDSESSEEEETDEPDQELVEWLNDD